MIFVIKIHETAQGKVVVISDKEIIGKKFEGGKLQLDLSKDFYSGKEMDEEKVKELVNDAYLLHLTGKKTVEFFIDMGLVDEDKVLSVDGVPHAEVCLVREE